MEVDEAPPAAQLDKRVCFCCGRRLGARQLSRHRTDYLAALNAQLAAGADQGGDNPDMGNDGMDVANGDIGPEDIDMENGEDTGAEVGEDPFAGLALDRDYDAPIPLLDPAPPHQVRRNPPVRIDNWPEPGSDHESGAEDIDKGPANGPDRDPPYEEPNPDAGRAELDPLNEYEMRDAELRAIYDRELGDLADEEWVELYDEYLQHKDTVMLRFLATCLHTRFSRQTWNELRFGPCEALGLPSEFIAWRRLRILAGLEIREYDCCVNSCVCFLGKYAERELQALLRNPDMLEKLGYRARAEADYDPDVFRDIFNGENYRSLQNTLLDPGSGYCFFDNPEDLLIVLSTDGFTLFKRRRHLNSYLAPLLDELLLLQDGVESIKVPPAGAANDMGIQIVLHAFLIMLFGDIPAVTKLLALKGHNAKLPCRTCYMQGVLYRYPRTSVYYLPLTLPGTERGFPPHLLLLRTHELFLLHYRSLNALNRQPAQRAKLSQELGINAQPIFGHLKSIDLSSCAPYDIMHLLFENLVPNMIAHWTGKFKVLDQGTGSYQLAPAVWAEVGQLTAQAACTIPSAFVGMIPDISRDQNLYKAEAYLFGWQYIGPIILRGRLDQPYYE
ncbi:hypothetical protein FRC10_004283 [Ceratobasidium sp. 414]|nr:hypothetical protein FRC10_004283 [Ceratobasidium sp. 414]